MVLVEVGEFVIEKNRWFHLIRNTECKPARSDILAHSICQSSLVAHPCGVVRFVTLSARVFGEVRNDVASGQWAGVVQKVAADRSVGVAFRIIYNEFLDLLIDM